MSKNINLNVSDTTVENIDFIKFHDDIGNNTQAIKTAINFYAQHLRKEDAKITNYTKAPKTNSVAKVKVTKAESDMEKGKELCVLDFEGSIVDEEGNPDANGLYCKYDSFEQVTDNKFFKTPDIINPLERLEGMLASGEKYRNTDKRAVDKFAKRDDVEFTLINAGRE